MLVFAARRKLNKVLIKMFGLTAHGIKKNPGNLALFIPKLELQTAIVIEVFN